MKYREELTMNKSSLTLLLVMLLPLLLSPIAQSSERGTSKANKSESKTRKSDDIYPSVGCNPFPECEIWIGESLENSALEKYILKMEKSLLSTK